MNYENQLTSPYVSPQAKSWFKTIMIGAASLLVLLLLCIHFGWSTLAGLIFALVGIACSVGCFFADTVKSMFGKGRAVTLGLVSLYLDLMATLAFATPNFFAGLGLNGWVGLTTLFFAATLGGSLALVQFQKASKVVSALIITLTLFGLLAGQTFSRGVQYLVGNMGNAFGHNVFMLGSKFEDSAADIRVKYQAEYQKKKIALDKEWETGKLSAKDYEAKRKALDAEYEGKVSVLPEPQQPQAIVETARTALAVTDGRAKDDKIQQLEKELEKRATDARAVQFASKTPQASTAPAAFDWCTQFPESCEKQTAHSPHVCTVTLSFQSGAEPHVLKFISPSRNCSLVKPAVTTYANALRDGFSRIEALHMAQKQME